MQRTVTVEFDDDEMDDLNSRISDLEGEIEDLEAQVAELEEKWSDKDALFRRIGEI